MRESESPTLKHMQIPVALLVGGTERLISAVSDAALSAQVLVAECTVADAATMAAQMRPLVIVMTVEVYQFDPDSFDALAQDVRSRLLTLDDNAIDHVALEAEQSQLMLESESQRPSWTGDLS